MCVQGENGPKVSAQVPSESWVLYCLHQSHIPWFHSLPELTRATPRFKFPFNNTCKHPPKWKTHLGLSNPTAGQTAKHGSSHHLSVQPLEQADERGRMKFRAAPSGPLGPQQKAHISIPPSHSRGPGHLPPPAWQPVSLLPSPQSTDVSYRTCMYEDFRMAGQRGGKKDKKK